MAGRRRCASTPRWSRKLQPRSTRVSGSASRDAAEGSTEEGRDSGEETCEPRRRAASAAPGVAAAQTPRTVHEPVGQVAKEAVRQADKAAERAVDIGRGGGARAPGRQPALRHWRQEHDEGWGKGEGRKKEAGERKGGEARLVRRAGPACMRPGALCRRTTGVGRQLGRHKVKDKRGGEEKRDEEKGEVARAVFVLLIAPGKGVGGGETEGRACQGATARASRLDGASHTGGARTRQRRPSAGRPTQPRGGQSRAACASAAASCMGSGRRGGKGGWAREARAGRRPRRRPRRAFFAKAATGARPQQQRGRAGIPSS